MLSDSTMHSSENFGKTNFQGGNTMEQNTVVIGEITYTISRSFNAPKTVSELLSEHLTQILEEKRP